MKDLQQKKIEIDLFFEFIDSHRAQLEGALSYWLPVSFVHGADRFNQALDYAVFPGGKRLRPYLTFIASLLGGASDEQALALSCAIEFIHTSSIILDDLPAMDDADLRRNRPALHLAFGEGYALLVAVALLNQAYALFADSVRRDARAERLQELINEAARHIGSAGMIAGQAAEFLFSGLRADNSILSSRELKTTALMRLMMVAGGIVAGASDADRLALTTFGESIGKAYQIYDDLTDALGERQSIGKSTGQDARHLRPTMIAELDSEEAREVAISIIESGKDALVRFGDRPEANLLRAAADYFRLTLRRLEPL
jgi:geranylgeranyl pyrophosphate synthase